VKPAGPAVVVENGSLALLVDRLFELKLSPLCKNSVENEMSLTDEDKAWIAERIDSLRTELSDRIEKTETTLLTEFHKWASPVELRQRSHAAAMRAFDAELEAVSDRVTNLERPKPPVA
jgi:hypothetical protein